jgi:hypothetical protein
MNAKPLPEPNRGKGKLPETSLMWAVGSRNARQYTCELEDVSAITTTGVLKISPGTRSAESRSIKARPKFLSGVTAASNT